MQGIITEGGAAPNVVPDHTVADFYIRYPDAIYLEQLTKMVDDAARAAALGTGTKVKIDHYGEARDGVSEATLAEVGFAYLKKFGGDERARRTRQGAGLRGDRHRRERHSRVSGSARRRPRRRITRTRCSPTRPRDVGHTGFVIDAEAMASLLFDFATHPDYRAAVKKEFEGIHALFGEYQEALKKVYTLPVVPDPQ